MSLDKFFKVTKREDSKTDW